MAQSEKKVFEEPYITAHVLEGKTWFKDYFLIIAIVALVILFSVLNPKFIGINNVFSIFRAASIIGFIAFGVNIILIISGLDLSAAAIANLSGTISIVFLMKDITNLPLVWIGSLLIGIAISLINGIIIVYGKVPAFIATLGMSTILMGISRSITKGGLPCYPESFPSWYTILGQYDLGHLLPVSVLMFIIAAIIIILIIEYSPLGRKIYAVGANAETSRHVGINVENVKLTGFLIAGLLYGIAGITTTSMFGYATNDLTASFLFPALISVLLGTSFLSLRFPNIKGTIISVILLSIIVNGFHMINLKFYLRDIIQGLILLIAIASLSVGKKKKVTL